MRTAIDTVFYVLIVGSIWAAYYFMGFEFVVVMILASEVWRKMKKRVDKGVGRIKRKA